MTDQNQFYFGSSESQFALVGMAVVALLLESRQPSTWQLVEHIERSVTLKARWEIVPTVGDDADLQEVYNTERQLLYVACTRARDHLLITGVNPASEFLNDFMKGDQARTSHG